MKLLYCPICRDVHGIVADEWRMCLCKSSGAQYNQDGMTATVGGSARVFGVGNVPFFNELFIHFTNEQKRELRQKYYGQPDTDAWWGEYPGDLQIFRISSSFGPRLEVKIKYFDANQTKVIITDTRSYTIDGKLLKEVIVPTNKSFGKRTRWQPIKVKKVLKEALKPLTSTVRSRKKAESTIRTK